MTVFFSGCDAQKRKCDKATWVLEKDGNGIPKRDMTLSDSRSVFQMMKKHYSRYTLDKVSSITGVSKENHLKFYEIYSATSALTRWQAWLLEMQPELYVEIGEQLAKEKGIQNGARVKVSPVRWRCEHLLPRV